MGTGNDDMASPNFEDTLRALPKAELHLHLRGAIPLEYIRAQIEKYSPRGIKGDIPLVQRPLFRLLPTTRAFMTEKTWTDETVMGLFRAGSFTSFLISFYFARYFIRDREDFQGLVDAVLESLKRQNIAYAEITVSMADYERRGIAFGDLVECLENGARKKTVGVRWIADVIRDGGAGDSMRTLEKLVAHRSPNVVGINLGGSEHFYPAKNYRRVYERARAEGFRLTAHAGEARGPASVWDAVRLLGAERIGHGVRAIEDPALVRYLAGNDICLEVCPTSNIFTGVYRSYEEHPLKRLYDAGVPVAISTDDPTFFRTTLIGEFLHARGMGLSENDLMTILRNGFSYSFLSGDEKKNLPVPAFAVEKS